MDMVGNLNTADTIMLHVVKYEVMCCTPCCVHAGSAGTDELHITLWDLFQKGNYPGRRLVTVCSALNQSDLIAFGAICQNAYQHIAVTRGKAVLAC